MSRGYRRSDGLPRTVNRTRARRSFRRWLRYAEYTYELGAPLRVTAGYARAWARYHVAENGRAPR